MDPKDLAKIWGATDNTRLTPKQISIRLPVHVSAKISAISEMFPKKTKTEIIGDLLAAALEQFAYGLSSEPNEYEIAEGVDPDGTYGVRAKYEWLVQKFLTEFENEEAGPVEE